MLDVDQGPKYVTVGRSASPDPYDAVAEAMAEVDLAGACFILAFVPAGLPLEGAVDALRAASRGTPVFGCTTAGQITDRGYETDTLVLMAFSKENFRCASVLFKPLRPFNATALAAKARQFSQKFRHTAGWNRLGLIFSDGLCKQEDFLVSTLEAVLDGLPVFGGSAGDGLRFENTFVLQEGEAHNNAAVLLLIETRLAFQGLGFDHFLPKGEPLVITRADQDERLVYEINGSPAAIEYARLVGCPVDALCPQVFAENPLLLSHNNRHYVRAISDATEGHALVFLAAIDEGLVMTLGKGREILATLAAGLEMTAKSVRSPDFILGFDCVLRKLEIEQKSLDGALSDILAKHRVYGFNTYGEQQSGLHMNQTFVGVAFFEPGAAARRVEIADHQVLAHEVGPDAAERTAAPKRFLEVADRLLVSVQQPELNRHVVARRRVVGIQLHGLRIGLDSALQRLHAVRVVRTLEVVALTFSQAVGVLEREFGVATPLVVLISPRPPACARAVWLVLFRHGFHSRHAARAAVSSVTTPLTSRSVRFA